jgi:seryl-tRNA synthetase
MNDPKFLRSEPEKAKKGILDRGGRYLPALEKFLALDAEHRALLQEVEAMRAKRNESSKTVGRAKAAKDEALAARLMAEVAQLKTQMAEREERLDRLSDEVKELLLGIPNLPHPGVPVGGSAEDNKIVRSGPAPSERSFKVLDHAALGERLGLMDFDVAAKLSGSRFSVLKGPLARLERAVGQFMLDLHTREHGYTEVWVPLIVRPEVALGTGQLPKFEQDLYKTGQFEEGGEKSSAYYLIPTAEVPLTNLVRESVLEESSLPIQVTALTPCFRQEAGSYGKDVRGLIRQHQFDKVELVWITKPEDSMEALEKLTSHAENVLKALGLPYRVVALCTGDMGFASAKTYDLEVWMPGEKLWREVSSCSNCWDYQARRMNARFRRGPRGVPEFVHTLNGSGVAVGRIFAAVLENYQRPDGGVDIPEPLRKYFGAERLEPTSPAGC